MQPFRRRRDVIALLRAVVSVLALAGAWPGTVAVAQTGPTPTQADVLRATIKVKLHPAPTGAERISATVTWTTGDQTEGSLFVSANGGPETLFGEGAEGSMVAEWISPNETYEFRLYTRRTPRALLTTLKLGPGQPAPPTESPVSPRSNATALVAGSLVLLALIVAVVVVKRFRRSARAVSPPAPVESTNRRAVDLWAVAAGCLIVALAWSKLAWGDATLLAHHDAAEQTWPWWLFNVKEIQAGHLPLWDPFTNGGQSHIGEGQAFVLYWPFMLLAAVAGSWASTTAAVHTLVFLHAILAFAGAYFVGRSIRLRPIAAIGCGLTFALGGCFGDRAIQQQNIFMATAWVPWVLIGPLGVARTGRLRWMLLSGFSLAMSLYAGHGQPMFHAGVVAVAILLFTATVRVFPDRAPIGIRNTVAAIFVMGVTGLGLAAAQLWPMLEYQARALRWVGSDEPILASSKAAYAVVAANATLRWPAIPSLFFRGTESPGDSSLYIGTCALVLAAVGIVSGRSRIRWAWLVIGGVGFVLALGDTTPLLKVAYDLLPFDRNRSPVRWLLVSHVAVSVLVGMGLDYIIGIGRTARVWTPVVAVVVAGSTLTFWATQAADASGLGLGLSLGAIAVATVLLTQFTGRFAVAGGTVLCCLLALELGKGMHETFLPQQFDRPHGWLEVRQYYGDPTVAHVREFLARQTGWFRISLSGAPLPENLGEIIRIPAVDGFAATRPLRIHRFQEHLASRQWDIPGVRFIITSDSPVQPPEWFAPLKEAAVIGPVRIYKNASARPLAWLVGSVKAVGNDDEAIAAVSADEFDARQTAVILKDQMERVGPLDSAVTGSIDIADYAPGLVHIKVTSSGPALLVTSEPEFPGWQAFIDGQRTAEVTVNYAFRGLAVPAGTHMVEFRYRPLSVYGGIALSLATAIAVGQVLIRRRHVQNEGPHRP